MARNREWLRDPGFFKTEIIDLAEKSNQLIAFFGSNFTNGLYYKKNSNKAYYSQTFSRGIKYRSIEGSI